MTVTLRMPMDTADMSFSLLHCTAEISSPQQALLRDHLSVPHGHQALSPRWQMDLPVGSYHSSPRPSSTYTQTRTVDRQHNLLSNGFRLVTAGLPGWCNSSYLLQGRVQGVLPFVRLYPPLAACFAEFFAHRFWLGVSVLRFLYIDSVSNSSYFKLC